MCPMRAVALVIALTLVGCAAEDDGVLSTSRLSSTHDHVGPYRVVSTVTGRPDEVTLHFSVDRGRSFTEVSMADLGDAAWDARIPGAPVGTQVQYFVTAGDDRDPGDDREVFAFDVLPEQGPCTVDSDCVSGEICSSLLPMSLQSCLKASATCSSDDGCSQGFRCDLARSRCVVRERSCTLASERSSCLTTEICDEERAVCAPRLECGANNSCPTGFTCQAARTLCLRR